MTRVRQFATLQRKTGRHLLSNCTAICYGKNRLSLKVADNRVLFTHYSIIFSVTNYFLNDSSADMDYSPISTIYGSKDRHVHSSTWKVNQLLTLIANINTQGAYHRKIAGL